MNIRGKVTSEKLFMSLLRALSESGKTGTLVVAVGDIKRRLYFEDGEIVGAASTAPEESFGQLLVERAIIQETTLTNVEGLYRENVALLGQRLVDLGEMSEEEVQHAIRLKVKQAISDIVSCPDGRFDFVKERLPDKDRVSVTIDTSELLSSGRDRLEQDRTPKPTRKATPKPAPAQPERKPPQSERKPPIQESQDPASARLRDVLELLREESSPPTSAEPREATTSRHVAGRSDYVPAAPHRGPPRNALIAVGVLVASLAALSAGYWYFHGAGSNEAIEDRDHPEGRGAEANHEAPRIETPRVEVNEAPVQTDRVPRPERRQDIPVSGAAKAAAKQRGTVPATDSSRPTAKTSSLTPSPPKSQGKSLSAPKVESAPRAAAGAPTGAGQKADSARPVVDEPPSSQSPSHAPAVGIEPPPNVGVEESRSEDATPPEEEANPEQPEPSGWQSAVFAPKSAVVEVEPTSEPAVQPGELVEPGPDVTDPVLLKHPKLKYPRDAKRRKVEAVVRVRVLVDEQGKVLEAKIEEQVGYGLDEAALKVARKAQFIPATKGTVPVKMWTVVPLVYRLDKE